MRQKLFERYKILWGRLVGHLLLMLSFMEGSPKATCYWPARTWCHRNGMKAEGIPLQGISEINMGVVTPASTIWCLIFHRLRRLNLFMKINGHWWSCHRNFRETLSMSSKWEPDREKTVATVDFGVNGVPRWHWKPALLVDTSFPCPSSWSPMSENASRNLIN